MPITSEQGRQIARRRWRRPDVVEARVDALAEHVRRVVDSFPPLNDAQRDRLRAAFRSIAVDGGGSDA